MNIYKCIYALIIAVAIGTVFITTAHAVWDIVTIEQAKYQKASQCVAKLIAQEIPRSHITMTNDSCYEN